MPPDTRPAEQGWRVAQRQRQHPGRFRTVLTQDSPSWARINVPLVLLGGLAFEGFFALHGNRFGEVFLNLAFICGVFTWIFAHLHRRTLRPTDPLLLVGCAVLTLASTSGLLNLIQHVMAELLLKALGAMMIIFALDRMDRKKVLATLRDSEEYLESIFESVPDPLLILGEGRRIIAGNRVAIKTFGEVILGRTCCETYLKHEDCTSCTVQEVFERRKPRFEIVRDHHGVRRFEVTTFPLFGRGGFSGKVIQQVHDVSSEALTEDVASLLQDAVHSVRDPVVVVGLQGELRHMNRAAERLVGVDPQGAPRRAAMDLLPFESVTSRDAFVRALRNWESWQDEAVLVTPEGERRSTVVSASPIQASDERLLGSVVLVRDVTEVQRLQVQLAQKEKLGAIGELVSGVAHELNNPLTAVYGFGQLLLADESLPEEHKEQVRSIYTHAERCKKIIESLLSFSRQDSGEQRPGDLNEVVRSAVELVGFQMRYADVDLRTDLEQPLPCCLIDSFQIQQVLVNLITNAQHAVTEKGDGGQIHVRTRHGGDGQVVLEVQDSGVGMPEEVKRRIFDPFFTTKGIGKGTGLGLSLSYGIIQSHGGRITVDSHPGLGTTFRIELPTVEEQAASEPCAPAAEADPVEPARVLVVDDEEIILELLRQVLEADGHQVEVALSAEEALARDDLGTFDAVFSDWRMPGVGGDGFYRKLVDAHPSYRGRVVFTTGDTLDTDVAQLAEQDHNPLLNKPFTLESVRRVLGAVVRSAVPAIPARS